MIYENIREAIFLSRPNRFVAHIEIEGEEMLCHVKNTGRCKELLLPGARIFVQEFVGGNRKTKFDLIGVYKGNRLINMDSQIPNKVVAEWLPDSRLLGNLSFLKPECTYGNSRLDLYAEAGVRKAFIEVKGVTLEEDGIAMFPDAPTERGIKHIKELERCMQDGYEAYLIFVIQMDRISAFTPNRRTHPEFAQALAHAQQVGVRILALDCHVTTDSIFAGDRIPVRI